MHAPFSPKTGDCVFFPTSPSFDKPWKKWVFRSPNWFYTSFFSLSILICIAVALYFRSFKPLFIPFIESIWCVKGISYIGFKVDLNVTTLNININHVRVCVFQETRRKILPIWFCFEIGITIARGDVWMNK